MLHTVCIRPTWTLRRQLLTSFGFTAVVAISVVMLIAILTTHNSGDTVQRKARDSLTTQVRENLGASTRYTAETLSKKLFDNLGGAAAIMEEMTMDRIAGYPTAFEDDRFVPFVDSQTNLRKYPLSSPPIPLEWDLEPNVHRENAAHHLGEGRVDWYVEGETSTSHGVFFMQGQCDPAVTDAQSKAYFPNCSHENNNVTNGSVLFYDGGTASPTNQGLYDKSADLAVLLKPLYESHTDVKTMGIYYANDGAGAYASFPGTVTDGRLSYVSAGCDWMRSNNPVITQPLDGSPNIPIGTEDEIQKCRTDGETIPLRRYNPLERQFCADQALHPFQTRITGPYLDASSDHLWLLTVGRAVYDRISKNFIACTLIDVSIDSIEALLDDVVVGKTSEVALVHWDDGTVVASPQWDSENAQDTVNVVDIDLGVDARTFQDIKDLVDYNRFWEPEQVQEAYKTTVLEHDGRLLSFYPIPVPLQYDELYQPKYLAVLSIEKSEVYDAVDEMDEAIGSDVNYIVRLTLIVGFSGMGFVLAIIVVISLFMTKPLGAIANVADQLVANAGNKNLDVGIDLQENETFYPCTPNTEVTQLVSGFREMISGLGAKSGAARIATSTKNKDVLNQVPWSESIFGPYYYSEEKLQKSWWGASSSHKPLSSLPDHSHIPGKVNRDRHVKLADIQSSSLNQERLVTSDSTKNSWGVLMSPLFRWTFVLIVVPLLVTMTAICVIVSLEVTDSLPSWLEDVEAASVALEISSIVTAAKARSKLGEEVIFETLRDLHLVTRSASWLLFGALVKSDSFTLYDEATEECKYSPYNRECTFYDDKERSLCDCEWDDIFGRACDRFEDPRSKQKLFFSGQSTDSSNSTGDRLRISFSGNGNDDHDFDPESTHWWHEPLLMPGVERGGIVSGYETTYDRIRALSPLGVAIFPIFNHAREPSVHNYLGQYVGFEADGMMIGYEACEYSMAEYSNFQSTLENKAYRMTRDGHELCPFGKYGYDCRCREWYDTSRNKELSSGVNGSPVHLTAPYIFSGGEIIASSLVASLIGPKNTYVGEVVFDFAPDVLFEALSNTAVGHNQDGFPILITPDNDINGGDTVVGPGYSMSDYTSTAIQNLLFPNDLSGSANRVQFEDTILHSMKNGTNDSSSFIRTLSAGEQESIFITWHPITIHTMRPFDPSAFGTGVQYFDTHMYTVAFAIADSSLRHTFLKIEEDINIEIDRSTILLIVLIVATAAFAAFVASRVAFAISRAVRTLLEIVNNINSGYLQEDIPHFSGGSLETIKVYEAFERLYKVVRFSNQAFFSGDMRKAYSILDEALALFNSLNNRKAIGIASNNLGNVLLTIGKSMTTKSYVDFQVLEFREFRVKDRALQLFDEAINIAQEEYENALKESKGEYCQQLANRLFNKSIFLLQALPTSDEIKIVAKDLLTAKELEGEARMHDPEFGKGRKSLERFEIILRRIEGFCFLLGSSTLNDVWGVEDLLEEMESLIQTEAQGEGSESPLFEDISKAGRSQQLQCSKIKILNARGDESLAYRIAVQMIVEDEYILSSVIPTVSTCLLDMIEEQGKSEEEPEANAVVDALHAMNSALRKSSKHQSAKNVFFCLDYSASMGCHFSSDKKSESSTRIECANKNLLHIFDNYVSDSDHVGFIRFNDKVDSSLYFGLEMKASREKDLRSILAKARTVWGGTRMYSALNRALNSIVLSEASSQESWIIALTDGCSADGPHEWMKRVKGFNGERRNKIHVLIIGVEVPFYVVNVCERACTISPESKYIDSRGGLGAMNEAFKQVAAIISGEGTTMETF